MFTKRLQIILCFTLMFLAGCGGGGGGHGAVSSPPASSPVSPTPAPSAPVNNVQAITVDPGPANGVNLPFVSVTVCAPSSSNCATIDHVLVDTGSIGLRLFSSVLPSTLMFPQKTLSSGENLVECTQFADGFMWGPIKTADIKISGEQASAAEIQVVGDSQFSQVPTACSNTGPSLDTVQAFGAKGVLGIGVFLQDCGPTCAQSIGTGFYYQCSSSTHCQETIVPLGKQIANPVGLFPVDNNGSIIELPSVPAGGAPTVGGSLIFGVDTESNNGIGNAVALKTNSSGNITTTFHNQTFRDSFVDSGSNGFFFSDGNTPVCQDFYCPVSTQNLSAVNSGTNNASSSVDFSVANADSLFQNNPNSWAFNNLAGPNSDPQSFDWGLPFFFGRHVYTVIEQRNTVAGAGPYVAY